MTWRSSKIYRSETRIWRMYGRYGCIEQKILYLGLYLALFAFLFLALKTGRKSKINVFRQSFSRIMKVNSVYLAYFEQETTVWHQIHVRHKKLNRLTHIKTILRVVLSLTGHWTIDHHWTWHQGCVNGKRLLGFYLLSRFVSRKNPGWFPNKLDWIIP